MEFMGGCLHEAIYSLLLSSFELSTITAALYNGHGDEDALAETKDMAVIQI